MGQWIQRIEDKIKRPVSTPIQVHQNDHQERDLKQGVATKLDKPAVIQTQVEEGHTEVRVVGPSSTKREERTEENKS